MWPFRRKRKPLSTMDKIIAGVVIGGAIGSIIGKKLLEKKDEEEDAERPSPAAKEKKEKE